MHKLAIFSALIINGTSYNSGSKQTVHIYSQKAKTDTEMNTEC